MKNITVSLPDEVYRKARIKAAERDTSVSALVREFLNVLAQEESDFERRKRIQREVIDSIHGFRAGDRLSREEAHNRDALSGHERPAVRHKQGPRRARQG